MQINFENFLKHNDTVAVAVSGGCDSMCLLHLLCHNAVTVGFNVVALNVEHGIRGEDSLSDTKFVKDYCEKHAIPLLTYSVDAPKYASEHKLSLEQAARLLRYECFKQALDGGKCTKIATAHHRDDNVETILFNLFRGTGLKGLTGIVQEREDGVIRPLLSIDQADLKEYAKTHDIPYVTDKTNLLDDYTRNDIRHNVVPKIKKIFPELNDSVERLSEIVKRDNDYLESVAKIQVTKRLKTANVALPCHPAILSRAVIIALKHMGVQKDWEKVHIDQVLDLATLSNGAKISLPKGITAIKEYDKIVFYIENEKSPAHANFTLGEIEIAGKTVIIKEQTGVKDLKSGLFADLGKIPSTAQFRTREAGDKFTKFGGGTKLLNDYFTDKKIPQRERDDIVLLANGNEVLAVLGVEISQKIKVDSNTKRIVKLSVMDKA